MLLPNYLATLPTEFRESIQDERQVWLFQSRSPLPTAQIEALNWELTEFLELWDSHGENLKARSFWLFAQFLLIVAPKIAASGCAMDNLFKQIKNLELRHNLGLFERELIVTWDGEKTQTQEIQALANSRELYFFDNSVHNWGEFRSCWLRPIAGSYLESRVLLEEPV